MRNLSQPQSAMIYRIITDPNYTPVSSLSIEALVHKGYLTPEEYEPTYKLREYAKEMNWLRK